MQKELDDVKLAEDDSLEAMKTRPITKGSGFIVNGSIALAANIGGGKSSLISKLMVIYKKHIPDIQIFLFHAGTVDSTTAENANKNALDIVYIHSDHMQEFVETYRTIKRMTIEFYKYYSRDDYWSSTLDEMKKAMKVSSLLPKAKEWLKRYAEPTPIDCSGTTYKIGPMINAKGDITDALLVFDDLLQFKGFTGTHARGFFKELCANIRHIQSTAIFSMQRFNFLDKGSRSLCNTWCLGYGQSLEDVNDLFRQSVTVQGFTRDELVQLYEDVERYEFLVVNSGMGHVSEIKVNK